MFLLLSQVSKYTFYSRVTVRCVDTLASPTLHSAGRGRVGLLYHVYIWLHPVSCTMNCLTQMAEATNVTGDIGDIENTVDTGDTDILKLVI